MTFEEVLDQAIAMLQRRGRLTYRTLQLQFQLNETYLEALKDELIYGQRLAVDEDGRVLVWTGDAGTASAAVAAPAQTPAQLPLAYTPPYLAEKILTSRSTLESERKQVAVLFADLKGSMELLADTYYQQALVLADELGMRPLQAHCHLGLGRLYYQTGQRTQARTELSTALALYRAMDMTFWLPQTEAALVQVGESREL